MATQKSERPRNPALLPGHRNRVRKKDAARSRGNALRRFHIDSRHVEFFFEVERGHGHWIKQTRSVAIVRFIRLFTSP